MMSIDFNKYFSSIASNLCEHLPSQPTCVDEMQRAFGVTESKVISTVRKLKKKLFQWFQQGCYPDIRVPGLSVGLVGYADDVNALVASRNVEDAVVGACRIMDVVNDWCVANRLIFNVQKTESIRFAGAPPRVWLDKIDNNSL
ncbi:hypothetical protein HHI36_023309 [Cryptolaemus montrouzieri]|uniref:Reverse transcriptase n=1 Tax=Cryptolaemus montrouzieri TaxID=559131 RepID=A0ABD2PGX4_9CUCU